MGLPLAGTHRPAERTIFYKNLRRLRNFPLGRQSRRPLQRPALSPVEADDSVRPQDAPLFTEIFGEFVTSQRADVGIGPYKVLCRFVTVRRAKQSPSPTKSRKREAYQMKKFLNEFKTFISRGNVMDMAIGVVIATAFGKISASLVADIIMPLIGCLIGGVDLATLNITLKPAVMDGETVVSEAVVLGLGTFLTTIIDFLLIAFVVFLVVKAMNMAKAKLEKPAEPEPEKEPEPTKEEQLLTEIRDLLKNK